MKHYIIDGNNLIGKSQVLSRMQKKDPQGSREKLANLIGRYFINKKVNVSLHFDGYAGMPIHSSAIRLYYSEKKTADERIKAQIDQSPNKRNLIVVTSDRNILEYAKACSCDIMTTADFLIMVSAKAPEDEEIRKIEELKNNEEFKRLFGTK